MKSKRTIGMILSGLLGIIAIVGGRYWWRASNGEDPLENTSSTDSLEDDAAIHTDATTPMVMASPSVQTLPPAPHNGTYTPEELAIATQVTAKFNTGDYLGALQLADRAMITATGSGFGWLKSQLPAILVSAGWLQIKLGLCDEAIRLLARADSLTRSKESTKGLAWCHHKLGNIAAAEEYFIAHNNLNAPGQPPDQDMAALYADSLETQGRFAEAVQILEQAGLNDRLSVMKSRAKESQNQTTDTSRNFVLTYRSAEHEDHAGVILEILEHSLDEFIDDYGYREPPIKLEVILYPAENFRGVIAGGPDWAEGVFDGRLRIPVRAAALRARDYGFLRTVLRHELVHALNAILTGNRALPSWFEEGIAQRLSCERGGCGKFNFPPTPGQFLPPTAFLMPYISLDAVAAGQAYRQSLFLIYSLEQLKAGDDPLRTLVKNLSLGFPGDSDQLLKPLDLKFADLHSQALNWWANRAFRR